MPEGSRTHMGSTMRLGSRRTLLQTPHCVTGKLYQNQQYIDERHRHRYEVIPDVVSALEGAGLRFDGKDETGKRMEILELPSHPFCVGVQFHPEFKSRPGRASALFLGLILSAMGKLKAYLRQLLLSASLWQKVIIHDVDVQNLQNQKALQHIPFLAAFHLGRYSSYLFRKALCTNSTWYSCACLCLVVLRVESLISKTPLNMHNS
ncbi:CTP synthase 2-like protein [Drosera capensis]